MKDAFNQVTDIVTRRVGSPIALAVAAGVIVVWAITGPLFGFGETWQLVINTTTTIVTFLMVFLIQRAQNKDNLALQLKLNELLASKQGASNRLLNLEDYSEKELETLHDHFGELARLAKEHRNLTETHSIEEAQRRHKSKVADRTRS